MTFSEMSNPVYGRILTFETTMETYEDRRKRTIRVWLPQEYDGIRRFPVMYMHDGQNLFSDFGTSQSGWHVNWEMESLRKDGLSAIIVGIDNASTRMSELCPRLPLNPDVYDICNLPKVEINPTGDLYAAFIAKQLKPFIDEQFLTLPDKENTAIGGSSMGGLMSLYMLLTYPDVFSKAMVFSPNLVTHPLEAFLDWIKGCNIDKLSEQRIFMFHGGVGLEASNWPYVQAAFTALQELGLDDTHLALLYDSRQPHYETAWRKAFVEAFRFLFVEDNSESKYYK